jgi:glutamate racemase
MYDRIFGIAANCQSLAGIERVIKAKNPSCLFSGAALQALVHAIEDHLEAEDICKKLNMREFLYYFTEMEAEVLIFGCTHFPYILEQVKDAVNVPIIDPGQRMLEMLSEEISQS